MKIRQALKILNATKRCPYEGNSVSLRRKAQIKVAKERLKKFRLNFYNQYGVFPSAPMPMMEGLGDLREGLENSKLSQVQTKFIQKCWNVAACSKLCESFEYSQCWNVAAYSKLVGNDDLTDHLRSVFKAR